MFLGVFMIAKYYDRVRCRIILSSSRGVFRTLLNIYDGVLKAPL